jgi:hypothetical protein
LQKDGKSAAAFLNSTSRLRRSGVIFASTALAAAFTFCLTVFLAAGDAFAFGSLELLDDAAAGAFPESLAVAADKAGVAENITAMTMSESARLIAPEFFPNMAKNYNTGFTGVKTSK